MKQILTIISLFCCIGMSAQDITPLDKIFDEMSAITKVPRNDVKQKINHGNGVVMYVHNHPVGKYYHCSKECGSSIPGEDMTVEETEIANEYNKKIFDGIFSSIGRNLDSLLTVAEESYHYESHINGSDTIIYSICMKNGEDTERTIRAIDGSLIFPDALETVSLNFTANPKQCGKHASGFGILSYNKNVYLPGRKSTNFEKDPYQKKITPILKRKDIKSWKFTWSQSADYDVQKHWNEEYAWGHGVNIKTADGKKSNEGEISGTMYFIPREKRELAEEIFTTLDTVTLNHTDLHPEQTFRYAYNVKEQIMLYEKESIITEVFSGDTGKDHISTHLLFGITPKGYYVAVADVANNFYVPREWATLKSFVDGEKKYIK